MPPMGGTPKNPEDELPDIVKGFFLYVEDLDVSPQQKILLKSLVMDKKRGMLTIELGTLKEEVDIEPTKTNVDLAAEITAAFEYLFDSVQLSEEDREEKDENPTISFVEATLH